MKLVIQLDMDNAAFDGEPGKEAARIIRGAIDRNFHDMKTGDFWDLRDINGNRVGAISVRE